MVFRSGVPIGFRNGNLDYWYFLQRDCSVDSDDCFHLLFDQVLDRQVQPNVCLPERVRHLVAFHAEIGPLLHICNFRLSNLHVHIVHIYIW
jgi:hypothetical protein